MVEVTHVYPFQRKHPVVTVQVVHSPLCELLTQLEWFSQHCVICIILFAYYDDYCLSIQREEQEKAQLLAGGTMTTAEPRPNAYVPSGEGELPVPKPYGSQAPFKPSQPGANMRHIRKPQLQPIDI